jgi:hypothetical protein
MNAKIVATIAVLMLPCTVAKSQNTTAPATTNAEQQPPHPVGDRPAFTPEELEQMLAGIALYPDALLSQIFMASTYPIEIVEADRWVKKNPHLKGDALAKELEKQTWDPSVRSLVNFPDILSTMSEQIGTTLKIGDAFIGQQKDVMDAVQRLRARAKAEGNLKTTEQLNVKTEVVETGTEVIVIESSEPDVIYVPSYNPVYVYGGWPYPSYPPYPYYPVYAYHPIAHPWLAFGAGVACGVAWGYAWGHCDWGHGDCDIDIDQNFEFNTEINRDQFKQNQADRQANRDTRQGDRQGNRDARQGDRQAGVGDRQAGVGDRQVGSGRSKWQHDPSHRQGVSYRNQDVANKAGAKTASDRVTQARNDYRGRAEAGRRDISSGAADSFRGNSSARPGSAGGAGSRTPSSANRPSSRAPSTANRSSRTPSSMNKGGALNNSRSSGSAARASSNRGYSSRSSSPSRSSGYRSSGGSRSGGARGGGSRGGGGRGGGGRR